MDTTMPAHEPENFALWHIPTSTLLLSTDAPGEILRRIECIVSSGLALDEMMLNIDRQGARLGTQHLGPAILAVLQGYL